MSDFFVWYFLATLLGWLTFPLAWRLFPALSDRGFSLARALGLLVWGYAFWMLGSLGVIRNDGPGLLLALVILIALSAWAFWTTDYRRRTTDEASTDHPRSSVVRRPPSIVDWLKAHLRLIVTVELLFFLAFAFMAFVRAGNPELSYTEKPMELAFINSILRSPTFPPPDPWLSGYAISYYYFGYTITAMLAKVAATPGGVAFNLMFSLIFALSAAGAFGIVHNLLAAWRRQAAKPARAPSHGAALLGPLFLLIVSNLEGFLEVLHRRGLFWKFAPDGSASSGFWKWLNLQELVDPPRLPLGWIPDRGNWIWRASRVINETDLAGVWNEVIDEFPFFSYLHGDLHPHVLAMPFLLLAVAAALHLFLGGWRGETNLGLYRVPVAGGGLLFGSLLVGGLAFLNTWDILSASALFLGAFLLMRAVESGWGWARLKEALALGLPLGVLAILLYLPFYVGFSSQASGILPNLESPTTGAQLWVMFAPLFLPIIGYLAFLWRGEQRPGGLSTGLALGAGIVVVLWAGSWALGLLASRVAPDFVRTHLENLGGLSTALYFAAAGARRLKSIGSLLTLLALLTAAFAFLARPGEAGRRAAGKAAPSQGSVHLFVLLLVLLGTLLVLGPEFLYLRDGFPNRMNTVFKFYYQAWILWSAAAAFGAAVILEARRTWRGAFALAAVAALLGFVWAAAGTGDVSLGMGVLALILGLGFLGALIWVAKKDWAGLAIHAGLGLVLFIALAYPVLALPYKTDGFRLRAFRERLELARAAGDPSPWRTAASVWTLDGTAFAELYYSDDTAAVEWLQDAPAGVIVEATDPGASYRFEYGMVSTFTGLPTVLGWPGHELQWRPYELQGGRLEDIQRLYETHSWEETLDIVGRYGIRYIYIGSLERSQYRVYEAKFRRYLLPVFEQGEVVIFEVP